MIDHLRREKLEFLKLQKCEPNSVVLSTSQLQQLYSESPDPFYSRKGFSTFLADIRTGFVSVLGMTLIEEDDLEQAIFCPIAIRVDRRSTQTTKLYRGMSIGICRG